MLHEAKQRLECIRETYLFGRPVSEKVPRTSTSSQPYIFAHRLGNEGARDSASVTEISDSTVTRSAGSIEITTTGIRINLSDLHDL